jgi:soluble lytic murein transglycosylase
MRLPLPIALVAVAGLALTGVFVPSAVVAQSGEAVEEPGVFTSLGPTAGANWMAVLPETVARDVSLGRHWHASLAWEELGWEGGDRPLGALARAKVLAGWRNWPEVARVLEDGAMDSPGGVVYAESLYLLARAREELESYDEAAEAYRDLLTLPGISGDQRAVVLVRLARCLARANRGPEAALFLGAIPARYPFLADWSALEVGGVLAQEGDAASVATIVSRIGEAEVSDRARGLRAEALLAAGDTAGAVNAFRAGADAGGAPGRTAGLLVRSGELLLAIGDSAGGGEDLSRALDLASGGATAVRAAGPLVAMAPADPDRLLELAVVLADGGEPTAAEEAYARWEALVAGEEGGPDGSSVLPPRHRLRRARVLAAAGEVDRARTELRALGDLDAPEVAAPALQQLSRLEARRGARGEARAVEDRLIERFPQRREAVAIVFFRGDDRQDAGDFTEASDWYRKAIAMSPGVNEAGLARMRLGQIHFQAGEHEAAAQVFEGYLADFPDGRRWDEAAYWAARSRAAVGDVDGAEAHLDLILSRAPLSYYAVLVSDFRSVPFAPEIVQVQVPDPIPGWVAVGVRSLDLIDEAGLEDAHAVAVARLMEQASEDPVALLALGEALNARGVTWRGINLGWAAKATGLDWDERILKVIYPFPGREAVEREARERGLDPFIVAGLIRQESAFWPEAVSAAGAVGLMQVMPATGRQLARSLGPADFSRATLFSSEVNVHLGSAFLADLLERFGPDLPFALAAYNAGPTRMTRWSGFPEVEDPLRFTERVPFAETRGYLKAVQRNAAIYRWLYSDGP